MDKEFFEHGERDSLSVSLDEVIKDLESKSPEAAQAEIAEMLDEVNNVMSFVRNRFDEISNKHKSISAVGRLGIIAGVSFCGKPLTFMGVGTSNALSDALKVIMMGMLTHED